MEAAFHPDAVDVEADQFELAYRLEAVEAVVSKMLEYVEGR